ncbi:monovalent cation/H(+) antiporter subunit G [Brumimicrobium glaciale]|uniref:Monovalent cation/H(+) antiporter subunit G n=1 Tax=Brumimicrobium glaciale TaxID=200475 RepID=A0A4Q4KIY3_9FLAO|nr:monovalent cation/H(+) antiporter subunit G [Brumimicrobium glaciale]RYM32770.1 monovalent cation/H(+) antiporter subunit G [Brumimicrobium glaciale]
MNDIIIMIIVSLGTLFILLAAIGLVRMPDLYLRMSVTTKAATLGVGLILIGLALYYMETSITTRVIAIIVFLLLTAPISAHVIGRASYFVGVPLWKKTKIDELEGMYNTKTHDLMSGLEDEEEEVEAED